MKIEENGDIINDKINFNINISFAPFTPKLKHV